MSILVIDVGTTALRAALVDDPLAIVDIERPPDPAGRRRSPASSSSTPTAMAAAALDAARATLARRRRPGRRRRHHQPAGRPIVWDRATGDAGRPGARLAGPAHRDRVHRRQGQPRAVAGTEPVGHQAGLAARHTSRSGRPRPVLRHRRHVAGVAAVRRRRARHRPHQRRRHRPAPRRRRPAGTTTSPRRSASRCRCCRARADRAASSPRPPPFRGARRSPPSSATSRRRWSARAAWRPGGQDHVRHRRHARRLHRPGGAGLGAPPDHGTFPIVACSHGRGDGVHLQWGVEAIMLSAGTNVEWLRDDLGLIDARGSDRALAPTCQHRRGRLRACAARPGHAALGLRRARHPARHHAGQHPGPRRAGRARGHRPPWRRPRRGGRGRRRLRHPARCASTAA